MSICILGNSNIIESKFAKMGIYYAGILEETGGNSDFIQIFKKTVEGGSVEDGFFYLILTITSLSSNQYLIGQIGICLMIIIVVVVNK